MDNIFNALAVFPIRIKNIIEQADSSFLLKITEFRIRKNLPLILYARNTPFFINSNSKILNHYSKECISVTADEFGYILNEVCNNSFHSRINTMLNGFVSSQYGSRIGIASKAVYIDGKLSSVTDITSLNIRIPKECTDCSRGLLSEIFVDKTPNVIIAGPPGCGKTTLLRDISRLLSSGFNGKYRKISVIDERNEIANDFDVGINTDIIRDFPKNRGIEMAVRTLSPEIIVCDEIGNPEELNSIRFGFSCGVSFIISVHTNKQFKVNSKSVLSDLISTGQFDYIVLLKDYTNKMDIIKISEDKIESGSNITDHDFFLFSGNFPC